MENKYYIGLDVGTDSVGWAVTDERYNIKRFKGNAMWGIRLFDESNTAQERRIFRTARRRLDRRGDRLHWLEELFAEEICKIDPEFFIRTKESSLYYEDKSVNGKYAIFSGSYTDKDYFKDYPTIYHLRRELIEDAAPHDIRLVYLALHHIIKYRGHFLFEDLSVQEIKQFSPVFEALAQYCRDNYAAEDGAELDFTCQNASAIEQTLRSRRLGKMAKKAELTKIYSVTKKSNPSLFACLGLLSGCSESLSDIYADDALKEAEIKKITLAEKFEDSRDACVALLGERFELLEKLKAVYDWAILADKLDGENYICIAMTKKYREHAKDLQSLKAYTKAYLPKQYDEIFKISKDKLCNYVAYSGHVKQGGKTDMLNETATQEEFCAYLKKVLGECKNKKKYADLFEKIENGTFCPKLRTAGNGTIPMQLHRIELEKILQNTSSYLSFLNVADENGQTPVQKVLAIFDYKIPYYVGPLNASSPNAWLKRSGEQITPWNIEDVVDFDASAVKFIENLTNQCSYLPQEDVLPKNSILYSKFTVLNAINVLKLDGEPIPVSLKQDIFTQLFLQRNKVTKKAIANFLKSRDIPFTTLTGIDDDPGCSMKPWRDLAQLIGFTETEKDDIIKDITVFGEEKRMLKKRLQEKYGPRLSSNNIGFLSKLNYTGWGRLSEKFLTEVLSVDKATGELVNVITALWQTNLNLMQLLYSDCFDFENAIKKVAGENYSNSLRKAVEDLYVSPKIKRPIYQTLLIVKELVKAQGAAPEKIFLEVAKGAEEKKRTKSRKTQLEELYAACKKDCAQVWSELCDIQDADRLRSDKLFLYFAQCGRCMYTGERIDLGELMGSNSRWDIDHIYPQSKIKDDSLHNNRVLAQKEYNNKIKGPRYPLPADTQAEMSGFWKYLLDKGLINEEKYNRLICRQSLTDEQLSAFINRQLVETRQSTKAIAGILQELYPKAEIVYVKAGLVSEFRQENDFIKSRDVNDLHHAKDAYLNIVVGNVYNVQCTHNKANFIKGLRSDDRDSYSMNGMFRFNITGAWDRKTSINTVKKQMAKNNILYTRYSYKQKGGLFDQQLVKKGSGQVPIKAGSPFADGTKYGRYNRPTSCYFCFAEFTDPGKDIKIRGILPVDLYQEKAYNQQPEQYIAEHYSVENVKILIPCIQYNACIAINGFRMHLSSKSSGGKALVYKPAAQLILTPEQETYIKRISNYLSKNAGRKITAYDKLTANENITLYDTLVQKLTDTVFKKSFEAVRKYVLQGRDLFIALETEKQCFVIGEIMKILHANVMSGNLEYIGGAKKSGIVTSNSRISTIKGIESAKLIHQSVTGLYEHQVDLLNM